MKLLIVESPGKIKKLKSILGEEWQVAASIGHIRDLPKDELGIDKANKYKMLYSENSDKKSVIFGLKKNIKECRPENVYLATDEDREGEAISYHLCQALGLDYKTAHRVTFNEITKKAVLEAVNNPRKINMNLVSAQEGRRALDRLVGYQISPLLWTKLSLENKKALSAGRVQSVALRLVVDRENHILNFNHTLTQVLNANFKTPGGNVIKSEYISKNLSVSSPNDFLKDVYESVFKINDLKKLPHLKSPAPPFSTSALQQDASRKLKTSVDKIMKMAQKLYEDGFITYMRTDSVNISQDAKAQAKDFINSYYGERYFKERTFKNKSENAQEAHEAIRPTDFSVRETGNENDKLYQLIRSRALASQMADVEGEKTEIFISSGDHNFKASSILLSFEGFSVVYTYSEEQEEDLEEIHLKEAIHIGNIMECMSLVLTDKVTGPSKRYDQAGLVKELEQKGIGRPATYASIISNILSREYINESDSQGKTIHVKSFLYNNSGFEDSIKKVTIGNDKHKLVPTTIGNELCRFLCQHFTKLLDYDFTIAMENELDEIAEGKRNFVSFVSTFDQQLVSELSKVELLEDVQKESEKKVKYKDGWIKAAKGKFGFYLQFQETFYNVKEDPRILEERELIKLLEESKIEKQLKLSEKEKSILRTIGKYQVRNGKYGIYITDGKLNTGLPEGKDYKLLEEIDCKELLVSSLKKKKLSDKKKK